MKRLPCLGVLAILTFSPAVALADGPPEPVPAVSSASDALPDAAHDLTVATGTLARLLDARGPSDHVHAHALALHEAAAQLDEDITRRPDDLRADLEALERAFAQMKDELRTDASLGQDPEAQKAWSRVTEAHGRLAVAWFAGWFGHHPPPPPALGAGPGDTPPPR